jgi:hypothetical protein
MRLAIAGAHAERLHGWSAERKRTVKHPEGVKKGRYRSFQRAALGVTPTSRRKCLAK